ncbi:MSMEG_0570 family nitrogen starvation response protein [Aquimarina sp. RZ0]|uniref:MSMEG_0570 family nitrogen starvation response protein n=1 Tax=Aquimarina sp. RZ0 TaxID=2607730 RepID=UPI0011F3FE41|nr:MSMEG_0570 family nitrogen starvation response protein [Aquimarina sp. RZ0]KAA1243129.1 MSMEG_0570 family nitrogen starvation response protein [Aquimarina sp. RZ0]
MPVTYVHIELPDRRTDQIYSPSSIIETYFNPGDDLPIDTFLSICSEGLEEASERVRQKFGYACTSAIAEYQRIHVLCQNYDSSKKIKIISIK